MYDVMIPTVGEETARVSRITCVICSLAAGGAQRNILRLGQGLASRGHEVSLLTLDPATPDFYDVPAGIHRVRASPAAFWGRSWLNVPAYGRRFRFLRRSILETRPDLVISFIDVTNVDVLISLLGTRIPVIVSERIDPRHHPIGWRWRVLRWLTYGSAARVVLVAADSLAWARKFIPRWNLAVIPNPVLLPAAHGESAYRRDSKVILAMGRLAPQKGFDQLISAFSRLAAGYPGWTVRIVGDGPQRQSLEEMIRAHDLEGRVELVGEQKDPFALMRNAACFVLPSRYEGFPMALAEAMAVGLPVVSYDCPSGPRELVREGVDGLLVPAGNETLLAAAIRRLMDDADLRQQLGTRAREVTGRFTLGGFIDRWMAVIREAAAARA